MADEGKITSKSEVTQIESDDGVNNHNKGHLSLEDFITSHYERQREEGRFEPTAEIDLSRTVNFFDRALAESQRMNKEVAKSHSKIAKLHAELGAERLDSWRNEHAAEVLQPTEAKLVSLASVQPHEQL